MDTPPQLTDCADHGENFGVELLHFVRQPSMFFWHGAQLLAPSLAMYSSCTLSIDSFLAKYHAKMNKSTAANTLWELLHEWC